MADSAAFDAVGGPLTERDYAVLERCFISREIANAAGWRRVTDSDGRRLVGADGRRGSYEGLAIPYYDPRRGAISAYRLRRDHPDLEQREDRVAEKAKYVSAPGAGNHLYFIPWTEPGWLTDETLPIVFCEGEKKCLALWSVAWQGLGDAAERPEFLPIGLWGYGVGGVA